MKQTRVCALAIAVLMAFSGCTGNTPPPPQTEMGLHLIAPDFSSLAAESHPISIDRRGVVGIWWVGAVDPATHDEAETYFTTHTRVVALETGDNVAGTVVPGLVRPTGEAAGEIDFITGRAGYSFVPSVPLAPGWYVLVSDASAWTASHPSALWITDQDGTGGFTESGSIYGRFYAGAPAWFATWVSCSSLPRGDLAPSCLIAAMYTEPVPDETGVSFVLRAEGAECVEGTDEAGLSWGWTCPAFPPRTVVEVEMVSPGPLTLLPGAPMTHTITVGGEDVRTILIDERLGVDAATGGL